MKKFKAISVFGILDEPGNSTKPTFLGIVEKDSEVKALIEEYQDVFGKDNILFSSDETPEYIMNALRKEAYTNLFKALNGPITSVITGLQTTKR